MPSIIPIDLPSLDYDQYSAFFSGVRAILKQNKCLHDSKYNETLSDLIKAFQSANATPPKPNPELDQIDRYCDQGWRLLRSQLFASSIHFDNERRATAQQLFSILNAVGDPTSLPYEQEYQILGSVIQELEAYGPDYLQKACVLDIVQYMHKQYNRFVIVLNRDEELIAERDQIRHARSMLSSYWSQYVTCIEIIAFDGNVYCKVIDEINQLIQSIVPPAQAPQA